MNAKKAKKTSVEGVCEVCCAHDENILLIRNDEDANFYSMYASLQHKHVRDVLDVFKRVRADTDHTDQFVHMRDLVELYYALHDYIEGGSVYETKVDTKTLGEIDLAAIIPADRVGDWTIIDDEDFLTDTIKLPLDKSFKVFMLFGWC